MECVVCGKYFARTHNAQKFCSDDCRVASTREREKRNRFNSKIRKRVKKQNRSIADITQAAIKEHLTYGQYVAKYGL